MTIKGKTRSRKLAEPEALRRVVAAINHQLDDLDHLTQLIAATACDLTFAAHGVLLLNGPETGVLHVAATAGEGWTDEKRALTAPIGQSPAGMVFGNKTPYMCPDTKAAASGPSWFAEAASELAVPIVSQGQTLGVLFVDSTQLGAFAKADQDRLALLADLAAIALENTRLFNTHKNARERWSQLFDTMPDAMLVVDSEFNVERVNDRFHAFFQLPPSHVLGHNLTEVLDLVPGFNTTEDLVTRLREGGKIDALFRERASQKQFRWRAQRVSQDGRPFYLLSFEERDCECP